MARARTRSPRTWPRSSTRSCSTGPSRRSSPCTPTSSATSPVLAADGLLGASRVAGVYSHQLGTVVGSHAIKMIGWGTMNGQDYWCVPATHSHILTAFRILANSWNTDWGMDGLVLFQRGGNNVPPPPLPLPHLKSLRAVQHRGRSGGRPAQGVVPLRAKQRRAPTFGLHMRRHHKCSIRRVAWLIFFGLRVAHAARPAALRPPATHAIASAVLAQPPSRARHALRGQGSNLEFARPRRRPPHRSRPPAQLPSTARIYASFHFATHFERAARAACAARGSLHSHICCRDAASAHGRPPPSRAVSAAQVLGHCGPGVSHRFARHVTRTRDFVSRLPSRI